jgi:S1-C subfamily serine protease
MLLLRVLLRASPRWLCGFTGFPAARSAQKTRVSWVSVCTVFVIFNSVSAAQKSDTVSSLDPGKVITKIAAVERRFPMKAVLGTGFCLTADCGLVVTSYHVAALANLPPTVSGEKVGESDLATGPNDDGAVANRFFDPSTGHAMKYAPIRDLAIFRMSRPLAKTGMHGIRFYSQQLEYGQVVDIFGFADDSAPVLSERKLARFVCTFVRESSDGLLEFNCGLSQNGEPIGPGESGGIVVDRKTQQAVGVLEGVGTARDSIAIAIPVWSLASVVSKFQPEAYRDLFSSELYRPSSVSIPFEGINVEPVLPEAYVPDPGDAASPLASVPTGLLQSRKEEPPEIQRLRTKAQELADGMENFIAVQTLSQGGENTKVSRSQYEISVIDGHERFRQYPEGNRELSSLPVPQSEGLVIGGEWAELPNLVGTKLGLKVWQANDRSENGHNIKVFLYRGATEDHVCGFRTTTDFGLFQYTSIRPLACSGEVWTDDDMNILGISEDLVPSASAATWKNLHLVVAYGWLKEPGEPPKLVPTSELLQGELSHKGYWCKAIFTNYREFSAKTKLPSAG